MNEKIFLFTRSGLRMIWSVTSDAFSSRSRPWCWRWSARAGAGVPWRRSPCTACRSGCGEIFVKGNWEKEDNIYVLPWHTSGRRKEPHWVSRPWLSPTFWGDCTQCCDYYQITSDNYQIVHSAAIIIVMLHNINMIWDDMIPGEDDRNQVNKKSAASNSWL